MKRYQIGNWSQYNKSLINRGSITFWFSEDAIKQWLAPKNKEHIGRPFVYSDAAISCAWTIRFVYHLPLRALQGFLASLMHLISIRLPVPSYTQISRRGKSLKLSARLSQQKPSDIVFDSTGLKIYGEGEWKVKMHGKSKRRSWRKVHFGIDPDTQEIIVCKLTESHCHDATVVPEMLSSLPKGIKRFYGDGIYDTNDVYQAIYNIGAKAIIPARKKALYDRKKEVPWLKDRYEQIIQTDFLGGDQIAHDIWKKLHGYHKRSLVETAMFRLKYLLGSSLRSRSFSSQKAEIIIKSKILNQMMKRPSFVRFSG